MDILNSNTDNYKGLIYYSGIGTHKIFFFNEKDFRSLIWDKRDQFNKKMLFDPRFCPLQEIIEWSGALLNSKFNG